MNPTMVIEECIKRYRLPNDVALDEDFFMHYRRPIRVNKRLATLLMCYKREATSDSLAKISKQPAAQIRDLRELGFKFVKNKYGQYHYVNENGIKCRKIIGFNSDD